MYHELTPDLYSATSKTFVGQVYTALGLRNIADAADSAGFGLPAALRRVRRVGEPRPDRPRGHRLLRPEAVDGRLRGRAGIASAPCARARSSGSTTRSPRAGGRGSWTSSARCRRRSHGCASSRCRPSAEHASEVRARGLGPIWVCSAVAFLLVALDGRRSRRPGRPRRRRGARVGGRATRHPRRLDVALPDRGGDPVGDPRPARRPRRARRRDARARRGDVPGRLPQSARGSVPARRRRRRRARRDDRDRVSPGRAAGAADAPRRGLRRRRRRGDAHVRRRALGAARARRRDADPRGRHRRRPSSRRGRPSSSSRTRRRCRRSTRGSSGTSRAPAGRTSF